jgi:hypothetical protein
MRLHRRARVELACGHWLATDVSTLSVVHRYHEPKYNMSLSIISRYLKTDSRNGEAEVTPLYCVIVRPHLDYFEVSWDEA